jgi:type VI secretion system secreted protein VgrG
MSTDVFSIHCDSLDGAKLAGFKGVEALSRPFEFDVFFTVPAGTDIKSAVGARATLVADRDDGRGPMSWHGVFAALRLLHETAERALYRASLVPALWLLSHHVRSHVHTRKKIDAFIADTLKDAGLATSDYSFHTDAAAYPQEEFVCQYRESHLDFLHRWFEREGLYYYFEHPDDGTEKMRIVDDKAHHHPLLGKGTVRYAPSAGADTSAGECLRELHADFRLLPASVLIADYNYANPSAPVAGEKPVSGTGQGKIREYGYRVFTEGEAARLASVKAQSIACRELVLTATGDALGLRAGYTFQLDDAPADLPAKYLAIEVRHAGAVATSSALVRRYTGLDQAETYRVDVVAIPATVQFRAPQSTPWPRIYGFENGTVDGPAESQYAQIDDQGRYLVRFKFDTSDLPDGSTSTYLRMMQPHGGSTEGWHFPLRKGTEVMVSFQGGDPDRPVIAGVVPNALTPSNVTNRNHTQNVLRTGGGNHIVMEDQEGGEFIDMVTPLAKTRQFLGKREFVSVSVPPSDPNSSPSEELIEATYHVTTTGDAVFSIAGAWYQGVGGRYYVDVTDDATVHYGGKSTFIVNRASNEFYKSVRNTTIKAGRTDTVEAGGMGQTINGGFFQKISPAGKQEVTGNWFHQVDGENHDRYGSWQSSVVGTWTAKVDGGIEITSPKVTINGAAVQTKATGVYKAFTPVSFETYGSKNSAGIQKADYVGVSLSATTYKNDAVGFSNSFTAVKVDLTGLKMDVTAAKISNSPVEIKNHGMDLAFEALYNVTAGLLKIG